jgi:hypothetical protein
MKGILIPASGYPEFMLDDIQNVKLLVFNGKTPEVATFDGISNYYQLPYLESLHYPINTVATTLKRLYTKNHNMNTVIRGDILVYSSVDHLPNVIDASVHYYFVDQVINIYNQINHAI